MRQADLHTGARVVVVVHRAAVVVVVCRAAVVVVVRRAAVVAVGVVVKFSRSDQPTHLLTQTHLLKLLYSTLTFT